MVSGLPVELRTGAAVLCLVLLAAGWLGSAWQMVALSPVVVLVLAGLVLLAGLALVLSLPAGTRAVSAILETLPRQGGEVERLPETWRTAHTPLAAACRRQQGRATAMKASRERREETGGRTGREEELQAGVGT